MNRFDALKRWTWSVFIVGFLAFAFAGCEGDDGAQGPPGPQGPTGADGQPGDPGQDFDPNDPATIVAQAIESAKPEACATCHGGVGEGHQAVYDEVYNDPSKLTLTITSVSSTPEVGLPTFTVTVGFSIAKTGDPLFDAGNDLALIERSRFYAVQYDSVSGQFLNSHQLFRGGRTGNWNVVSNADGTYVMTSTGVPYAPETPVAPFDGAQVYGYIADGALIEHEGGSGAEIPSGSHVHLYDDVSNAAFAFGTAVNGAAGAYQSVANVAGCQKCHGSPYLKHGYRAAAVTGIPDFAACKVCHYDDRDGGHEDWQYMVDEPFLWATGGLTEAEIAARYGYTANIMNDVHMSHAMEFPYPQSMQNCATCHDGQLDTILADEYFTAETCLSCHPVVGTDAWPKQWDANGNLIVDRRGNPVPETYGQPKRAPALEYLWFVADAEFTFHTPDANCYICHGDPVEGFATTFREMHTGYDVNITSPAGERYAELYTVQIESITLAGNLLTVDFTANNPAIVPELLVSFYGWDSKQFIVAAHTRDNNRQRLEYVPESSCIAFGLEEDPADCPHPYFTEASGSVLGDWSVTLDMAAYAPITQLPDTIPAMIADGRIKKAEVTITPELNLANLAVPGEDLDVVLRADNETFDLVGTQIVDNYFKGTDAVVSTAKCNVCHDALASSFHSESGRDGDGVEICKNCHVTTSAGSHIEMASRAIDNYVHAIHTFQAFDVADQFNGEDANENPIPAFDPVFAKRYDMHIKHVFPNFTIRNCEACHVTAGDLVDPAGPATGPRYPVVYNVPDQSKSMPGLQSKSDVPLTWYDIVDGLAVENPSGRNLGFTPEIVTGPASRACGGCHRARFIRDDDAGDLASLNAHIESGGTYAENDDPGDEVIYGIIDKIMSLFE